jgi:hypothetical protein
LSATVNDTVSGAGLNQWDYGSSGWFYYNGPGVTSAYQMDEHYAYTTNVVAHFRFRGTQVKIYTVKEPHGGIIGYKLDNLAEVTISNYAPTIMGNMLSYTSPMVADGNHDLVIRVTGTHQMPSDANAITVDKAEVYVPSVEGDLGNHNTAEGNGALISLTTGTDNTAVGFQALLNNTTGNFNDAVGAFALLANVAGNSNNALGDTALFNNVSGSVNTAIGDLALANNDSTKNGLANNNTAVGGMALFNNVDGSENTAVGTGAGPNVVTGFNNTYVGDFVGTLAADESNTIRIGDLSNGNGAGSLECYIGGIFSNFQPVGGTVVEVTLDLSNDKLGWDVGTSGNAPVPAVSRSVPQRRSAPQLRSPLLPAAPPQRLGMLNNKVEKLQATVAQQQKQIETLAAQLKEQAAQIQKVSARIEANKPAPRVVDNNR